MIRAASLASVIGVGSLRLLNIAALWVAAHYIRCAWIGWPVAVLFYAVVRA